VYAGNSNGTSVKPPGRPAHELNYTPLDLVSEYAPPKPVADAAGEWSTAYVYDDDKRLDLVTRPGSLEIDYRYDDAGRLESQVFPSPITPSVDESSALRYDTAGRLRTLTSPSAVTLTYGYDGPLVVSETWSGAVNGSLARGYDDQFRVTSETVAGTPAIAFGYDRDGLLTQAGALALTRDASTGLLVGTTLGGISDRFDYNAFGELSAYAALAPDTSTLFGVSYARDALGRITSKTETIAGVTTVHGYSYDAAGRLEVVKKDGVETARYTYDENGNRLSKIVPGQATITATYDEQDRLVRYGDTTYTYTANGELLTKTDSAGTTRYAYDVLGNLRRVVLPDETVIEYLVDGKNRRVGKKVNGTLVQAFVYGTQLAPAAELDGSGAVVSRFLYGTRVNVPEYIVTGGATLRVITDHLGSPRLVVDAISGSAVQYIEYDEWGDVLDDTNREFQSFGFGGGLYDRDTRLISFGARDYNAASGVWTRKDRPELTQETLNLYSYSWQDPVNFADPAGELPFPAIVPPSSSPGGSANDLGPLWPPRPVPDSALSCSERRGGETCTATCPYGPDAPGGIAVVGTVTGQGKGKTKSEACAAARQDANAKVPRGMRAKHCQYS
jgi:RHS repeat-associated protein